MIKRTIICVLILGIIILAAAYGGAINQVNENREAMGRTPPPTKERVYGGDGRVGWEYPVSGVPGTHTIIIWDD